MITQSVRDTPAAVPPNAVARRNVSERRNGTSARPAAAKKHRSATPTAPLFFREGYSRQVGGAAGNSSAMAKATR